MTALFRLVSRYFFVCLIAVFIFTASRDSFCAAEDSDSWDKADDAGERRLLVIGDIKYAFRFCPAGTYQIGSHSSEREIGASDESGVGERKETSNEEKDFVDGNSEEEGNNASKGIFEPDDDSKFASFWSEYWEKNPEVLHNVKLTSAYWIMETEVTQLMWLTAMGNNPSKKKGANLPVNQVSWYDCQNFIKKLNSEGVAPKGWVFSLPTEAEWEVAARAGSVTAFPWGNLWDNFKANGWEDGPHKVMNVGYYPANDWGICDAIGNVWEWCLDTFESYPVAEQIDPCVVGNLLSYNSPRITRGGSWRNDSRFCRSAYRGYNLPLDFFDSLGFRCVLVRKNVRESQLNQEKKQNQENK